MYVGSPNACSTAFFTSELKATDGRSFEHDAAVAHHVNALGYVEHDRQLLLDQQSGDIVNVEGGAIAHIQLGSLHESALSVRHLG